VSDANAFTSWLLDNDTGVLINQTGKIKEYRITPPTWDWANTIATKKKGRHSTETHNTNYCKQCNKHTPSTFWSDEVKNWVCHDCRWPTTPNYSNQNSLVVKKECDNCHTARGPLYFSSTASSLLCKDCKEKIKEPKKKHQECYMCASTQNLGYDAINSMFLCDNCNKQFDAYNHMIS